MKEQLIAFETAKLAKNKGFDSIEGWSRMYNQDGEFKSPYKETYPAPTQSLLQKWLREKHNILVESTHFTASHFTYKIYKKDNIITILFLGTVKDIFDNYEHALEKGLQEALKLI